VLQPDSASPEIYQSAPIDPTFQHSNVFNSFG
jgi:hypothetical protein